MQITPLDIAELLDKEINSANKQGTDLRIDYLAAVGLITCKDG